MVTTRNTRADVVEAAGRLFAERGYHGTSMRDLGRELGLLGSSLYSHVESKQDLLVEVVEEGASLFRDSSDRALALEADPSDRLTALIEGHIDVVLDNLDVARTYLNEARMLDSTHRDRVVAARDEYEEVFRRVLRDGVASSSFRHDLDVKTTAIFILSTLNAVERWYSPQGALGRSDLKSAVSEFALSALR